MTSQKNIADGLRKTDCASRSSLTVRGMIVFIRMRMEVIDA